MIELRFATPADNYRLFAWRNDPVTRAAFRSTEPISGEDHERWMKFNVEEGYAEHVVLIAEKEKESIGVVRFDADKDDIMSYEVSLTIAPGYRGRRLAGEVLARACHLIEDFALTAQIREENIPSRRVFEECGFAIVGREGGFINYRREPIT
jgi:RimJ/RimL family protein N-acetyltransferase